MHLCIRAIGILKKGPEKSLVDYYQRRLHPPVSIQEFPVGSDPNLQHRKVQEGQYLLSHLPRYAVCIALDEGGDLWTSPGLADHLQTFMNKAYQNVLFFIGGADGLSEDVLKHSQYRIAFGRFTWPHLLVRGLLLEQLYRAQQILSNHPYHRK